MTDREQRILEAQWHRTNNPVDANGRPLTFEQQAVLSKLRSGQAGGVFLPEGTESFDRFVALYEGNDFSLAEYRGLRGVWVDPPYGFVSAAWHRDGIFLTPSGVGDFDGDRLTFTFPKHREKRESAGVKKYRNVMNGLLARAAK